MVTAAALAAVPLAAPDADAAPVVQRGQGAALWDAAATREAPLHGIAVELAPQDRRRHDAETEAYVDAVKAVPADAGPLDRVLTVAGRLPEPATWALMILGFGGIGGAMRRRMRRSEADFTARIKRIVDGDE